MLAIDTLSDYEGIGYKDILSKTVDTVGNIVNVEKAKYHREGIYNAIKDACQDYSKSKKEANIIDKTGKKVTVRVSGLGLKEDWTLKAELRCV